MGDKSNGLYQKFIVKRTDGSDAIGGKHSDCEYFVLDMTHDKHAIPAIKAYAKSCAEEYPLLADDLMGLYASGEELPEPTKANRIKNKIKKIKKPISVPVSGGFVSSEVYIPNIHKLIDLVESLAYEIEKLKDTK